MYKKISSAARSAGDNAFRARHDGRSGYCKLLSVAHTVLTVIPDFGMPLVANFFPEDAMKQAENEVHSELKRFIKAHFKDPLVDQGRGR